LQFGGQILAADQARSRKSNTVAKIFHPPLAADRIGRLTDVVEAAPNWVGQRDSRSPMTSRDLVRDQRVAPTLD
jgi:hypothetical protein